MNLTPLAAALTAAGVRSQALMHRRLYMSATAFWLERASHRGSVYGVAR